MGICPRGMLQRHVSPLHHTRDLDLQKFSPGDMSREIKPKKIHVTCRGDKISARFVRYKFHHIRGDVSPQHVLATCPGET